MVPEADLIEPKPRADTGVIPRQLTGRPLDGVGKVRLGKVSIDKIKIAEASSAPFNLKEELTKLKNDSKRHVQLIGEYLEEKEVAVENKAQLQVAVKRHLRAATQLAKFSDKQIGYATSKAEKEYPDYTLETLVKVLTR